MVTGGLEVTDAATTGSRLAHPRDQERRSPAARNLGRVEAIGQPAVGAVRVSPIRSVSSKR